LAISLAVPVEVSGQTEPPLIAAVKYDDNPGRALAIIRSGADVNVRDNYRCTPLMLAVEKFVVARALVENGADINAADELGRTPLMHAAMSGEGLDALKFLLSRGAQVDRFDKDGSTALMFSVERPKFLSLLLSAGANCRLQDARGETAYSIAKRLGVKRSANLLKHCVL